MEASISFKAVGKTIGSKTLLADLSFGIEKGSTFVIIGENGSGKSMILKLLVGLIQQDTGSVYIHGQDIATRSLETRSICGYMPQSINLDEDLTIFENIFPRCASVFAFFRLMVDHLLCPDMLVPFLSFGYGDCRTRGFFSPAYSAMTPSSSNWSIILAARL